MKKNLFLLVFIVILGLAFRLIFLDKPDGLWNDEYVSWSIAAVPIGQGFVNAIKSQCHMPVYYLYLKFFMYLFNQSDLLLRSTSVFAGILSVITMYFVGREKDETTGLLCAGFSAISSFLIYYSQEVRLYSLLFFFSALSTLFTLKLIKNSNIKNLLLYFLSNVLIILTHTIGFVYVFFNIIFVTLNLSDKFKRLKITIWSGMTILFCASAPLILKIITTQSFSQWWNHFTISKIGFLFTDYFSPVLTNLTSAPDIFFYAKHLIFYMTIPTIIAIVCITKSLYKNKINQGLFYIACAVVLVLSLASLLGKLVFITKYSIEIYPILIYLACSARFQIKSINILIVILYFTISSGYLVLYPYSAPKMHRAEGHKIVADILNNMDLKENDWILLEYYPQNRFEKYFDFSKYNVLSIDKGNFAEYLSDNVSYSDIYKNGKVLYKDLFLLDNNNYLGNKLNNIIFDKLENGQSIVVVMLNSVAFVSPDNIKKIAENENLYKNYPFLFLVFSHIKNELLKDMLSMLEPQRAENKGNWTLIKFTKINN